MNTIATRAPGMLPSAVFGLLTLLLAVGIAWGVMHFHAGRVSAEHREMLEEATQRSGQGLQQLTLRGRTMGTAELLGLASGAIRASALGKMPPDAPETLEVLRTIVAEFGAENAFVIDGHGVVVAYHTAQGRSGTGRNLAFRPYFTQAMAGRSNIHAAVGTNSDARGLYHAAPVYAEPRRQAPVIGVVVIKIGLEEVERHLAQWGGPALLLTPEGVVFATNRPEWLFAYDPALAERLTQGKGVERYGNLKIGAQLRPLPFSLEGNRFLWNGLPHEFRAGVVDWKDPWGAWRLVLAEDATDWIPGGQAAGIGCGVFFLVLLVGLSLLIVRRNRIAREENRLMESRLENALQGAELGLWELEIASDTLRVSPIWARMHGLAPETTGEMAGGWRMLPQGLDRWRQLLHPEDREPAWQELQSHLKGETPLFRMELRMPGAGEAWRWVLSVGRVLLRDRQGRPVRFSGVHVDIDAGKSLQMALQRAMVDNAKSGTLLQTMLSQRDDAIQQIHDSIRYASRIQRSILPPEKAFEGVFSELFILWDPRDVIGGDIYWHRHWGAGSLVLLGDCTGHGIPGAFMTLIANGALDQAYLETPPGDPAFLLQRMHQLIQTSLGQDRKSDEGSNDGIEVGACYLDDQRKTLIFAGASFDLFVVRPGGMERIKGTRAGLGYRNTPYNIRLVNQEIELTGRESFYMTSDGLIDQVGGERGCGFGVKRFQTLLAGFAAMPMQTQLGQIRQALAAWQGEGERRDDVSVLGFRVRRETDGIAEQRSQEVSAFPMLDCRLIDDDHRRLYRIVDKLKQAMEADQNGTAVMVHIEELVLYTKWHFRHEERLMETYHYGEREAHQQAHARLIGEVGEIIESLAQNPAEAREHLLRMLQAWLTRHIHGDDKRFADFLIGLGVDHDVDGAPAGKQSGTGEKNTGFFVLDDALLVGYGAIDDDHRKLVEIMNQLHGAMDRFEAPDRIAVHFNGLIDYTIWHFHHEERLMQLHGYPAMASHKRAHQSLISQVHAIRQKLVQEDASVPYELNAMLKSWLIDHIHKADNDLALFLRR
ncbi:MAG: bacteriohemerythrin [Magnetococcales bacterium]|nr:bacteriohemerythrin [Magnetococcales bacterium]